MLFNSYVFIIAFFPIVMLLYFGINGLGKYEVAKVSLIIASLVFYGYFNWSYLLIIILSILLNFWLSKILLSIEKNNIVRKIVFFVALTANIGSLFFFKYFDFFISNVNSIFNTDFTLLNILLPLGISFFTFQQLSYVIDSYKRDKNIKTYRFLDYALFVTYFPQLIAGPIVTHDEMVPQFSDERKKQLNYENFATGLFEFSLGIAKKVIIADSFGLLVDKAFTDVSKLGTINAILVMLAYTFQIYFDFSGYCEMAMGIGKMMNIDIAINFNSPYKATNIVDFWKRWHITLTRFFTRYIYFPLGGNRKGLLRTYINIFIVFFVSGIWHGANWTFIVWGGLHGFANVITRIIDKKTGVFLSNKNKIINTISWIFTFLFLNLSWIIFRAESLEQAKDFFCELMRFNGFEGTEKLIKIMYTGGFKIIGEFIPYPGVLIPLALFAFSFIACVFMKNTVEKTKEFKPSVRTAFSTVVILIWCILSLSGVSSFLYWNF